MVWNTKRNFFSWKESKFVLREPHCLLSDFTVKCVWFCLHRSNNFGWHWVKHCERQRLNQNRCSVPNSFESEQARKVLPDFARILQLRSGKKSVNCPETQRQLQYCLLQRNVIYPSEQGESRKMQNQWRRSSISQARWAETQNSRQPEIQKSRNPVTSHVQPEKKQGTSEPAIQSQYSSEPGSHWASELIYGMRNKLCTCRRYVYRRSVRKFSWIFQIICS